MPRYDFENMLIDGEAAKWRSGAYVLLDGEVVPICHCADTGRGEVVVPGPVRKLKDGREEQTRRKRRGRVTVFWTGKPPLRGVECEE